MTDSFPLHDQIVMIKGPHGQTIRARLTWDKGFQPRTRFRLAQKWVDNEVLKLSDPLTPLREGNLIGSGSTATSIGSGLVKYNAAYARYQYYGHVMAGRAPKHVTGIPLTYGGAPQRGAKWFERMKVKSKGDLMKGAARIISGGH